MKKPLIGMVAGAIAFIAPLALILIHQWRSDGPTAAHSVDREQVIQRLDRLGQSIIQLGAQSKPDDPAGPVIEFVTPPLPTPHDDARQSRIRASNPAVGAAALRS